MKWVRKFFSLGAKRSPNGAPNNKQLSQIIPADITCPAVSTDSDLLFDLIESTKDKVMIKTEDLKTKILAVGLNESVSDDLVEAGYAVQALELGRPFTFEPSATLTTLPAVPEFPLDYKEHDIVIVDLIRDSISIDSIPPFSNPAKGIKAWWTSKHNGRANPSLLRGLAARDGFDRILVEGGIFVIFLGTPETQEFIRGAVEYRGVEAEQKITCHSMDFLQVFDHSANINFSSDAGMSIALAPDVSPEGVIGKALKPYLKDARFRCVVSKKYSNVEKEWVPILENKFGAAVGALMGHGKGTILLLPDFQDKSAVLKDLLRDVLPEMAPKIFPNLSGSSWVKNKIYEPSDIIQLSADIEAIREKAARDIEILEKKIEARRDEVSIQFDLARETGDNLVNAVKAALTVLGFKKIVDADDELRDSGILGQNREDLQVLDCDPALIVEIKGIRGFPSDDDALAVQKYVVLRMKE